MCPAFLSASRLPSLSYQLWVAACLASFLPLSLAFYVAVKLRKLNAFVEKTKETKGSGLWKATVLKLASFRPIEIRRGLVMIALASLATFAVMRLSEQQRGYCEPTGDLTHSDNMTVLYKISDQCFMVLGKDAERYRWCVNATTPVNWASGTYISEAEYEYRNGFADFTNPNSKLNVWPSKEAYDESRR